METHEKTVSSNNGIFNCNENNEFSCLICTDNRTFKNKKQHESTSVHIETLERFNLIFTNSTNGIICKVCGASLHWEILITHANWHKIVPWYKPTDRYKTFFSNRVIECQSEFYCHPCNKFFPEWSTAYIHTKEDSHKYLLKNQPGVNDFAFWNAATVPYDILVSEAFVSNIKTTTVKCTVCDCQNISLKNVPDHVKGQQHLHKKIKFLRHLNLLKDKKNVNLLVSPPSLEESGKKLAVRHSKDNENNKLKSRCDSIAWIYIVEQEINKFSCKICDLEFFSRLSVELHIMETRHADALKKYGCEQLWLKEQGYIYHCKSCDCPVLGIKNVHQHVRGSRHKNSLSQLTSSSVKNKMTRNMSVGSKDEIPAESENPIKSGLNFLPDSHRKKLNSQDLQCNFCNVANVQNHNNDEKTQVSGVEKLAKNIVFSRDADYQCKCCNSIIPSLNNVYNHINGNRHANSPSALEQRNTKKNMNNFNQADISKQPESFTDIDIKFLLDGHMEKLNSKEWRCKLCQVIIPNVVNIQTHCVEKNHDFGVKQLTENIIFKEGNNYQCKCCKCMIPGLDNVYSHINGNRHAKSLCDKNNRKENAGNKKFAEITIAKPLEIVSKSSTLPNYASLPNDDMKKRNNTESHYKPCDGTIPDEFNIQNQLTGPNHVIDDMKLLKNITSLKGSNNYHCNFCDCMISGLNGLYVHLKKHSHAESFTDLDVTKANKKNFGRFESSKQAESGIINTSSMNNYGMLPENHIDKRNGKVSQCRLCNKDILDDANIEEHVTSQTHRLNCQQLSVNISFITGNNYQCNRCDCTIPGVENIYRHINGLRHAKSLENFVNNEKNFNRETNEEVKQLEKIAKSSSNIWSFNHIFKLNCKTFCCKICNCIMSASSNINNHITGKQHAEAVKMYSYAITTMKTNKHYCNYCKLAIHGTEKVYAHLQKTRHKSLANKANNNNERQESANRFAYIAYLAELEMRQRKPKAVISEVHSPPENIPCQFCDVPLRPTSGRSHSHLAIHIGADLFDPEEPKNIKNTNEFSLFAEQKDTNGDLLSQLTAKLEDLQQTELPNHDPKFHYNSIEINGTKILPNHTDLLNSTSAAMVPTNEQIEATANRERTQNSSRHSSMLKIAQFLNPENNFIYDMRDKMKDTNLGMKLCLIKEMKKIYCLICRKDVCETAHNYFRHLSSADHCECLEGIEKDHALFELVPEQFSEFDLVCQYMEEASEYFVHCHACNTQVENVDINLKDHVNNERHKQLRQQMHSMAKQNFEDIKSFFHCDWYTINTYWCEPCSEYYQSELTFAKHLKSTGHGFVIRKPKNIEKALMHDFCSACGLLWFGFRCTYANHCETLAHKWIIKKNGDDESEKLTKIVKILLAEVEQYVDFAIKHFDRLSVTQRDKEEIIIRDLEMAVKSKFSDAKAFSIGSKASGFRTADCDFEIFLNCGNKYDGSKLSECETLYLITTVHQCLSDDPQSWDVNKILTPCRSFVLKVRHYITGLTCEVSFGNELAVWNVKLIKYLNDIFPPCRKLILFLYEWLSLSGLAEPRGISNNALYWYMIFYLQNESLLPSVGSLIAIKNHSHSNAGRKIGLSFDFSRNEARTSSLTIRELVINFFTFCVKFDYRYDVVSPLFGQEVKKLTFVDEPQSFLPEKMASYINYMNNFNDSRPFRIDSVMCVQDPIIVDRNLTQDISKAYLIRFRACCIKSLDVLRNSHGTSNVNGQIDESGIN